MYLIYYHNLPVIFKYLPIIFILALDEQDEAFSLCPVASLNSTINL